MARASGPAVSETRSQAVALDAHPSEAGEKISLMDRQLASRIAQAWIDAGADEQAALNQFDSLEEALATLLPAGEPEWAIATVSGRPTVLAVDGRSLFSLSVVGGERSGPTPTATVRCHHVVIDPVRTSVSVSEQIEGRSRRRNWRFEFPKGPPLRVSTVEALRGLFTRKGDDNGVEGVMRALAAAAGWQVPEREAVGESPDRPSGR